MDQSPGVTIRHVLAVLASALIGLTGAIGFANPATAAAAEVSSDCTWDAATGEWVVDWTVTPVAPEGAAGYEVIGVEAAPAGTVAGFGQPEDLTTPLTGEQRLPADAELAQLTVQVAWFDGVGADAGADQWHGEHAIPAGCEAPDGSDLIAGFSYDCRALTITIRNPGDERLRLTFAPTGGDPFEVEVASGESASVRFPAIEGQSVDVRLDGRSIVDPAAPIEITAAQWRELDCDDNDGAETVGLAATGSRVALVTVGALALLGLGGGLYLVARRRRIRFTA